MRMRPNLCKSFLLKDGIQENHIIQLDLDDTQNIKYRKYS